MPIPCLVVEHLEYYALNGDVLIKDLSLTLPDGAILAIAGPRGPGQNALLELLSGQEPIALGDIRLRGRSLRNLSPLDRNRHISVLSHTDTLDEHGSLRAFVGQNLAPIGANEQNAEIDAALDLCDLSAQADIPMAALSAPAQLRARIAQTLARRPALLILDGFSSFPISLTRISDQGICVVMTVPTLANIPASATHVALMNAAHLVGFGPVNKMLTPKRIRDTFGCTSPLSSSSAA